MMSESPYFISVALRYQRMMFHSDQERRAGYYDDNKAYQKDSK